MQARDFLCALWGDVPQSDGPFIQLWTLASKRSEYYASAQGVAVDGEPDVFTGVGLAGKRLGAGHRAKANEVVALAGLWLDLDVAPPTTAGPGGSSPMPSSTLGKTPGRFANHTQALSFANHFKRPTITVDSGSGGVHAWYLFPQPWRFRTRDEQACAGIIAQQWVGLHQREALRRGVHLDSVGDLARILRVPGTVNSKCDGVVTVLEGQGPRHTYSDLALLLRDMPIEPQRPTVAAARVPGDATRFDEKLDALLANSPEFAAAWDHHPSAARRDLSPSAWDLCLCTLAHGAMNDAELQALIRRHRETWDYDLRKLDRAKYVDDTIAKARAVPASSIAERRAA